MNDLITVQLTELKESGHKLLESFVYLFVIFIFIYKITTQSSEFIFQHLQEFETSKMTTSEKEIPVLSNPFHQVINKATQAL